MTKLSGVSIIAALLLASPNRISPSAQSSFAAPQLQISGPIHISTNTRIAPGTYTIDVPDGQAVVEIDGDNVTLDLTGVTIQSSTKNPWERVGTGIRSKGHRHITIRNGAIHGYRFGILLEGNSAPEADADGGAASDYRVTGADVSGSRAQKLISTPDKYDEGDWVDIFHLEAWESYGAGIYIKNARDAWIEGMAAHDAQNGILLAHTSHINVYGNDVSRNSGWGIALWDSSWTELLENHADWDVRCESTSYSHGCDSAGVLLMSKSNHNRIVSNSFTHSGDGYFLSRTEDGVTSDYNYVAFNDGSYSPHNSFESTFSAGDEFYHNIANHSDYGFWLGFSRETTIADNYIEGSKRDGIAIEHGQGNTITENKIHSNGLCGIRLFRRGSAPDPSTRYSILQNSFVTNPAAIIMEDTSDVTVSANTFTKNTVALKLDAGVTTVKLLKNKIEPDTKDQIQSAGPNAISIQIR
jgi:parallel beta-helix repeat protein